MEELSQEEARRYGVRFKAKRSSETGEIRARVTAHGIDASITAVPAGGGGWQKSHRHRRVVEHTRLISGEVVEVEQIGSAMPVFRRVVAGESFSTTPGNGHNLFVTAGTLMVTVKEHDDRDNPDWIADPELDSFLSGITWEQALQLATSS